MPTEPVTTTVQPDPATTQAGETPASWDEFLNAQPEPVKALYASHSAGLLNTVQSTRKERDAFAKQVKDLLPKVEKGSELEKSLTDLTAKIEATERRASFLEDAMRPEVQCKNAKAAWLLAQAGDLFDKRGLPDWAAIKTEAPELFGVPTANANAGNGTQQKLPPHAAMNDFIRAGRG